MSKHMSQFSFSRAVASAALSISTTFAASQAVQAALLPIDTGPSVQRGSVEVSFDYTFGTGLLSLGTGVNTMSTSLFSELNEDGSVIKNSLFSTIVEGALFTGSVTQVGFDIVEDTFGGDTLQFLIDLNDNPFSDGALFTLTGEFGVDNSTPFGTDFSDIFTATLDLAPISPSTVPLPAGFPLAATAFGALLLLRRRKGQLS